MSSITWAPTYLKTVVTIRVGDAWVDAATDVASAGAALHVITAWNPGTGRPSEAESRAVNERLRADLERLGCSPVPAIGADPDSPHLEETWAVVGRSDAEARRVGAT